MIHVYDARMVETKSMKYHYFSFTLDYRVRSILKKQIKFKKI